MAKAFAQNAETESPLLPPPPLVVPVLVLVRPAAAGARVAAAAVAAARVAAQARVTTYSWHCSSTLSARGTIPMLPDEEHCHSTSDPPSDPSSIAPSGPADPAACARALLLPLLVLLAALLSRASARARTERPAPRNPSTLGCVIRQTRAPTICRVQSGSILLSMSNSGTPPKEQEREVGGVGLPTTALLMIGVPLLLLPLPLLLPPLPLPAALEESGGGGSTAPSYDVPDASSLPTHPSSLPLSRSIISWRSFCCGAESGRWRGRR